MTPIIVELGTINAILDRGTMSSSRKGSADLKASLGDDKIAQINRERNAEHARKTRVRKKQHLQSLKNRVCELEEEGRQLRQSIQECSVASILLGLSGCSSSAVTPGIDASSSSAAATTTCNSSHISNFGACLPGGKRKRFESLDGEDMSVPPMQLNIKGTICLVGGNNDGGGKSQINWKTGVYMDVKGRPQQLAKTELEELRRERNRMHAKMTRDRKKSFIASLKRVISKLESDNHQLREELDNARADESLNATSSSNDRNTQEEAYAYTSPLPRMKNHTISVSAPATVQKISPPTSNQPFYTVG